MPAGINHYVIITSVMFGLGLYTVITYKHPFKLLAGIALLFLAGILNFAVFSNISTFNTEGQVMIYTLSASCILLLGVGMILLKKNSAETESRENDRRN